LMHYISMVCGSLRTPFRGVSQVEGGGAIVVEREKATASRLYTFAAASSAEKHTGKDNAEALRELLYRAVEDRMQKGSRGVAHLSGVYDSSSIVCVAEVVRKRAGLDSDHLPTVTIF